MNAPGTSGPSALTGHQPEHGGTGPVTSPAVSRPAPAGRSGPIPAPTPAPAPPPSPDGRGSWRGPVGARMRILRRVLLAGCRPVLGEDVSWDPATVLDLKVLRFGPDAYLGVADAACGSLASVLGCAGGACDPPAGFDIPGQGSSQFLGVAGAQVDLVVRAVQAEKDGTFCFAAVEVSMKKVCIFWAMPLSIPAGSLFFVQIIRHIKCACRIDPDAGIALVYFLVPEFIAAGFGGLVKRFRVAELCRSGALLSRDLRSAGCLCREGALSA